MKVAFSVSDLKGLKGLSQIAGSNRTNEAWRFLLVDTAKNTVTATNDSITQVSRIAMQADNQGAFLIEAERFSSIVGALSQDATLNLKVEKDSITLTSKSSRYKVPTISLDKYARIDKPDDIVTIGLAGEHLTTAIESTVSFAGSGDVRAALNGVYVEHTDKKIMLTATNGHQLSHVEFESSSSTNSDHRGALVSVDFLRSIQRHCDGAVSLFFTDKKIGFANKNTLVWGRLIDQKYPDYAPLLNMPAEVVKITPATDLFKGAVARVRPLLGKKNTGVTLTSNGKNVLHLSVSGDMGEGQDELQVEIGETVNMKLNATYLDNVLRGYSGVVDMFLPKMRSKGVYFKGLIGGIKSQQVIMPMND